MASSLAAVPILSRYLGVAGFGVYATVNTFITLTLTVTDLGLGATAVREVAAGRLEDGPTATTAGLIRPLFAVPILLISLGIAATMGQPREVVLGLALSSIYVLTTSAAAAGPTMIFRVKGRFGWTAINAAVQAPLWIASILFIVFAHMTVLSVFVAMGLSAVITLIISALASYKLLDTAPRFNGNLARSLIVQGWPLGVASILAAAYYKIDTIILSAVAGSLAVGLYGAAYRFIDQTRVIASYIGIAYHPLLAKDAGDESAFRQRLGVLTKSVSLAGATAAVGLFALAEPATRILFGQRFVDAPGLLRILSLAIFPMFLNNTIPYAMIARRRQEYYIPINLVALIFNVVGNLVLIPHFGSVASAILTGLTETLVLTMSLAAIWKTMGFLPPLETTAGLGLSLAVGCAIYLVVHPLSSLLATLGCLISFSGLVLALRLVEVSTIVSVATRAVSKIQGVSLGWVIKMRASGNRQ
jgi:O-antigen/teichoic acid export membrane protein